MLVFSMNKAAIYFYLALGLAGDMANADDSAPTPAQSGQTTLPRVLVTGKRATEDGYRVDAVDSLGPLGTTKYGFAPRFVMTSDAAYLNGNFGTGGLRH